MAFNHGMMVDLYTAYMLMLVSMTLTLMQGHSGSAEGKKFNFRIISTSKQIISVKLATTVGHFLHDLHCDFENIYMA